MKAPSILIVLFIVPLLAMAQYDPIKDFMGRFDESPGVNRISLQGNLLRLAKGGQDDLIMKIEKLNLLSTDEISTPSSRHVHGLVQGLSKVKFDDLIRFREDGKQARIMVRENGKKISDVLLLLHHKEGFLLLHLEGLFEFSDLNDLDLDIDGDEFFKRLPDDRSRLPQA